MFVNAININQPYNNKYISRIGHHVSNTNERKYTGYSSYPVLRISFHAQLPKYIPTKLERFEGCLFGGALGDAFGRLAEYRNIEEIKYKFGKNGAKYIPKINGKYLVTDDTQMTLFTADGLIKSFLKKANVNEEPIYSDIYNSYLNWYKTQTVKFDDIEYKKGLMANKELYANRGPGTTCLMSLKAGIPGDLSNAINSSDTNGGIMRISPIALMYNKKPALAFKVSAKCAALTHSKPEAYLSAGFLGSLLADLSNGKTLDEAIKESVEILKQHKKYEKTLSTIKKGLDLADTGMQPLEAISAIGKGKAADEALAIALYSVKKHPGNYKEIVATATNHNGDSDTTAAIAGNIAGALYGIKSIPKAWSENVEFSNLLSFYANNIYGTQNKAEDAVLKQAIERSKEVLERWDSDKLFY